MNGRGRARHTGGGQVVQPLSVGGDWRDRLLGCLLAVALLVPATVPAVEVIDTGTFIGRMSFYPDMYWMDDDTLLFGGGRTPDDANLTQMRRLMTYSVATRSLKDLGSFFGALCYDRGYVRYLRPAPGTEIRNGPGNQTVQYAGMFGKEQAVPPVKPLPGHQGLRSLEHLHICLWDAELPPLPAWTKGKLIKTLRPEHGFVLVERNPGRVFGTYPIRFYRPDEGERNGRPITAMHEKDLSNTWQYVSYKDAYWVKTSRQDRPPGIYQAWWVYPDGRVELMMEFDLQATFERYISAVPEIPIRDGFLFTKGRLGGPTWPFGNLRSAGLYRFDIKPQHEKLVAGEISNWAVSPNGCRVAFGNDTRLNNDGPPQYRVQIIDVCTTQGGKHQ